MENLRSNILIKWYTIRIITLYLSKFTEDHLKEFLYQLAQTLGQHLLMPYILRNTVRQDLEKK